MNKEIETSISTTEVVKNIKYKITLPVVPNVYQSINQYAFI